MKRLIKKIQILIILVLFLTAFSPGIASNNPWTLSVFGGYATDSRFLEVISLEFGESLGYSLIAVTMNREIFKLKDNLSFEIEGQLARLNENSNPLQVNGAFALRLLPFFWNRWIGTSVALFEGLSYVDRVIAVESRGQEKGQRWLNFLTLELDLFFSKLKSWSATFRIHHRSGVFGVFGKKSSGSNYLCGGLKYKF